MLMCLFGGGLADPLGAEGVAVPFEHFVPSLASGGGRDFDGGAFAGEEEHAEAVAVVECADVFCQYFAHDAGGVVVDVEVGADVIVVAEVAFHSHVAVGAYESVLAVGAVPVAHLEDDGVVRLGAHEFVVHVGVLCVDAEGGVGIGGCQVFLPVGVCLAVELCLVDEAAEEGGGVVDDVGLGALMAHSDFVHAFILWVLERLC